MTATKKRASAAVSIGVLGLGGSYFTVQALQQAKINADKVPVLEAKLELQTIRLDEKIAEFSKRFDKFESKLDSFLFQVAARAGL